MMTRRIVCSLLPLAIAAHAAAGPVRSEMLVSTQWLAEHLSNPGIVLLHVSRDRAAYDEGHIPGARFLAFSEFTVTRNGAQNELPPAADLKRVFEQAGVSDDSRVILYGDASVLPATRAYFTLDYMGHGSRAALLDGGLAKWRAESRPLTRDNPAASPGRLTVRPRPEVVAGTDAMRDLSFAAANNGNKATTLLDVRRAELVRDSGRIPGAVNLYWMESESGGETPALLQEAELRRLFESAGVTPDRPVVTYCGSGVQATQTYFALKYLGYDNVCMYDGSFSEWTKAEGPVEK